MFLEEFEITEDLLKQIMKCLPKEHSGKKVNELNRRLEVLNRTELNQEEWNEFEVLERTFRKLLVTKKQEEKISYIHQDPTNWWKLVGEISRIYMKAGFSLQREGMGTITKPTS